MESDLIDAVLLIGLASVFFAVIGLIGALTHRSD
jgi:hypothetical protein